jgi:hypothetical protein
LESLANPGTRVVEEQKQRAITNTAGRSHINLVQDQAKLLWFQVIWLPVKRSLGRNGKDVGILVSARWIVAHDVSYPATQSRQPTVACGGLISSMSFEHHQKIEHLLASNVGKSQAIHAAAALFGQVDKK